MARPNSRLATYIKRDLEYPRMTKRPSSGIPRQIMTDIRSLSRQSRHSKSKSLSFGAGFFRVVYGPRFVRTPPRQFPSHRWRQFQPTNHPICRNPGQIQLAREWAAGFAVQARQFIRDELQVLQPYRNVSRRALLISAPGALREMAAKDRLHQSTVGKLHCGGFEGVMHGAYHITAAGKI